MTGNVIPFPADRWRSREIIEAEWLTEEERGAITSLLGNRDISSHVFTALSLQRIFTRLNR